jgi:hypothetical protein
VLKFFNREQSRGGSPMSKTRREQQPDRTPPPEEPAPRTEETPTPAVDDGGSDWQGYSPEILGTLLDS